MNLLTDPWVPVREAGEFKLITYEELLCEDRDVAIALTRDDMEHACLQLLVSLTQVTFTPRDKKELRARIDTPLTGEEFKAGIEPFIDWFDVAHSTHPFMQVRGVEAKGPTSIQKLFTGLPEGDGTHTFFNDSNEIQSAGLAAAAIALFNQASTSPNFGGGFKGALRGVPVTTLIRQEAVSTLDDTPGGGRLRRLIWWNVLHFGRLRLWNMNWRDWSFDHFRKHLTGDQPTWVRPIERGEKIAAADIGLLRGLFWQPAHVELLVEDIDGHCDYFDIETRPITRSFKKAKFTYDVSAMWQHPHSAKSWKEKNNQLEQGYVSFRTTAPAWTQLTQFMFERRSENKEGSEPAAVVHQYKDLSDGFGLELSLGGYRNKQASVVERRHELLQIGAGWQGGGAALKEITNDALAFRENLVRRSAGFGKAAGVSGLGNAASSQFYQRTEALIHEHIGELDHGAFEARRTALAETLSKHCLTIFDQITQPYRHKPKMLIAREKARAGLEADLAKLRAKAKPAT